MVDPGKRGELSRVTFKTFLVTLGKFQEVPIHLLAADFSTHDSSFLGGGPLTLVRMMPNLT